MVRRGAAASDVVPLPFRQLAGDAVEQQRRIADDGVERRAQLVRHAGEEVGLELVRFRQLLRLPEQPLVLLREVGCRGDDAIFQLAIELLERVVEPLVLDLLREVVQHRNDRDRLAAVVADLSRHDFYGERRAVHGVYEHHALAFEPLVGQRELGDERRKHRVVLPHRLRDSMAARPALGSVEELLRLVVHEDDVGGAIGDEDRVGDVLEDQVEAVALVGRLDLGLPDAPDLPLQFVGCAAQVGHVAQHGEHRVRRTDPFGDWMRENLEQQIVPLVRVDEVELPLPLLESRSSWRERGTS